MIVVDADNGGKIGPTSFVWKGFLAAFYTDAAGEPVSVANTGTVLQGGRSERVLSGGESSRVLAGGASSRVITGGVM